MKSLYSYKSIKPSSAGGCETNYRIVEKEIFKLVGFKKTVAIIFQCTNPEIAKIKKAGWMLKQNNSTTYSSYNVHK
ncbi:MAG TPA: hypothetical protein PK733_16595 [Clostridiales bacterium]|nr:hypothetical protein [Clostridiales bacterium]